MAKNQYYVRCFTKCGWNYCDHSNCSYEDVKRLRRTAKMLGETIEVEKMQRINIF